MLVSKFCDLLDIRDITVRITECLEVDSPCVLLDGALDLVKVMSVYECCLDAVLGKCVGKKIVASAVDCLLCDDVSAVSCESLDRISDCCCTGCYCKSCCTSLECCNSLLEYALCAVCDSSVTFPPLERSNLPAASALSWNT